MRLMSFALTTPQILDETKDVTRRVGWLHARPGQQLRPVRKCMGLRPGERIEVLRHPITIVSVRREPLRRMIEDINYGFNDHADRVRVPLGGVMSIPITRPALRYHGGKFRLAPWVLQFFPPHQCYVEPYGGAASVLLQKPRAYAEVYNDLDGDIVNFFHVLRHPQQRLQLLAACELTPYARAEFELAHKPTDDPVERARRTAVRAAMGFGSASATKGISGFRIDTRRSYGTAQHNWADYPAALGGIGDRMTGVVIENRPALLVMQQHDAHGTLHFVDPPYMPETRETPGKRYYRHEMTADQHAELLDALLALQGMVVLCGYPSALYDARLCSAPQAWHRHTTTARISGNRGTSLRTEVIWINPACHAALHSAHGGLFEQQKEEAQCTL